MRFLPRIIICFVTALCGLNSYSSAQDAFPDPNCVGAVQPRLIVGQSARVLPGDANNVRDIPSVDGIRVGVIPANSEFIVLEGPNCVDGLNWWRVDFDGLIGWTVEGQDTDYWLEPLTAENSEGLPANPFRTPEHIVANALSVDADARLQSPDDSPLSLYALASANSTIVTQLSANTIVTLREDAPGGWRFVETNDGQAGWLQDGILLSTNNSSYFFPTLAPICTFTEGRVAFSIVDRVLGENLYTTETNGNRRCNLTFGITRDIEAYDWSADGSALVFSGIVKRANFTQDTPQEDAAFIISSDGRTVQRIIGDGYRVYEAAWSPQPNELPIALLISESEAFFTRDIVLSNLDGSEQRHLTTNDNQPSLLRWSPDGTRLAFLEAGVEQNDAIHVIDVESGEDNIVYSSQWNAISLAWRPDSAALLVSVYDNDIGYTVLKNIDIESLTTSIVLDSRAEGAVYNSDASAIAYWRAINGRPRQIWVLDTSTNETAQIAILAGINDQSIIWTDDDKAVLVNSEGILRVDINTGELQRLFLGNSGTGLPQPTN